MNKFKNATKRIAAVAASAALVSSTAFAGLGSYPSNFVKNDKFIGDIVVGSGVGAADTTAASTIISDLKAQFAGNTPQVEITYTSSANSANGETFKIANPSASVNYGERLGNVRTQDITRNDVKILNDATFSNGLANEDYTQKIRFDNSTGIFAHSLNTNAGETILSDNLYIRSNTPFMTYDLNFATPVDYSADTTPTALNNDLVGRTLEILGSTYTITTFSVTGTVGSRTISSIDLIGGTSTLNLGEGASSSVTIGGKTYDVSIQSVAGGLTPKVLLTINGVSNSINLYDTQDVAGISVAVTDLVPSSRDSVKGYAQIVIGGQKITLRDNQEVKINDRFVSDISPKYYAKATFRGNTPEKFDGFKIFFQANQDMVIKGGSSFDEPVFNLLSVKFDGLNVQNSDYSSVKFSTSGDRVNLNAKLIDGINSYNQAIAVSKGTTYAVANSNNDAFSLPGKNDVYTGDVLHVGQVESNSYTFNGSTAGIGANIPTTGILPFTKAKYIGSSATNLYSGTTNVVNVTASPFTYDGVSYNATFTSYTGLAGTVTIIPSSDTTTMVDLSDSANNGIRFLTGDKDTQYMWELGSYDTSRSQSNLKDIFTSTTNNNVKNSEWTSTLDGNLKVLGTNALTGITGTYNKLATTNQRLIDLSKIPSTTGTSKVTFTLDTADTNVDQINQDNESFVAGFYDATNGDNSAKISFIPNGGVLVPTVGRADITQSNSDIKEYATPYGTLVRYDSRNNNELTVKTPNKQVEANINLVIGGVSATTQTMIVNKGADATAAKAKLIADGNTIVGTKDLAASTTTFDITAPKLDSQVTGTDGFIVVGGPAVNSVARELLGITTYTKDQAGVNPNEGLIRYFAGTTGSVLVYGYEAADTVKAVEALNKGGLSGDSVNTQ